METRPSQREALYDAQTTSPAWTAPEWPFFGLDADVEPFVLRSTAQGHAVALATLVVLDGGGPRRPGARMAISAAGEVCGYLSGGCIEADIVAHARGVLSDGQPRVLRYGLDSPWFDLQLPCGGGMTVMLERIAHDDPALRIWRSRGRAELIWHSDGQNRELRAATMADVPEVTWDGRTLHMPIPPPQRLLVVGHNPSALAIALMGTQIGFETHMLRDTAHAATPLQTITLHRGTPAATLARLTPDRWTAIAVAGHDEISDREALAAALVSPAGYVGLLGARRRLDAHRAALLAAGVCERQLERLRAPIGLPIGAHAPWEIALSVMSDIVAHRHGVTAGVARTSGTTASN